MTPAPRLRRAAAVLACALALLAAGVAGHATLQALLPVQRALLAPLVPAFDITALSLESAGGHLLLQARLRSREHLVAFGRVMPPGVQAEVATPARACLRTLLASCIGAAWLRWRRRPALVPVGAGIALGLVQMPLVLAGELWSLYLSGPEPSMAGLLSQVSQFLLHGGDDAVLVALFLISGTGFGRAAAAGEHAPRTVP